MSDLIKCNFCGIEKAEKEFNPTQFQEFYCPACDESTRLEDSPEKICDNCEHVCTDAEVLTVTEYYCDNCDNHFI